MSIAYKCDRCGKLFERVPFIIKLKEKYPDGRPIHSIVIKAWGLESNDIDLCDTCGEEVRDFLGRDITCLKQRGE